LADVAELLGQFQQTDLGPNYLLLVGHIVVSVAADGRAAVPVPRENRDQPAGSCLRKPTRPVRLRSS
jgi:hypothetical protein